MGGKAFPESRRVTRQEAIDTYRWFIEVTQDPLMKTGYEALYYSPFFPIGSTGLAETSGDIDLCFDLQYAMGDDCIRVIDQGLIEATWDHLLPAITKGLGTKLHAYRSFAGIGMMSFLIHPIIERQGLDAQEGLYGGRFVPQKGRCQLDVILCSTMEWSKWAYGYDPADEWKGLYRNELLFIATKHFRNRELEERHELGKDEYARYWYDPSVGLMSGVVEHPPHLKNPRRKHSKQIYTTDPAVFSRTVFGCDPGDLSTWKKAWKVFDASRNWTDSQKVAIIRELWNSLTIKKKVSSVPSELMAVNTR